MEASRLIAWVIVLAVFYSVGKIVWGWLSPNRYGAVKHCMTCGVDGQAKRATKGSTSVEVLLWLFFILPGLIYSVWRLSSRFDACPACGSTTLVPLDSPAAGAHRKALGP